MWIHHGGVCLSILWLDTDDCRNSWMRFGDSIVAGAIFVIARTLQECQRVCEINANCTGVNWNSTAPDSRRCSISGPWSGELSQGTATGVDHYRITRPTNCVGKYRNKP